MIESEAILIAGPTASGKSGLALQLAEERNGLIINADSMQVYKELSILTARPNEEDLARAPHRLYGFYPAAMAYSVGHWVKDVAAEIQLAAEADRLPIIVGGTGMYFSALLEGLSPVPEIPPEIRQHWRNASETTSPDRLHLILKDRDEIMAQRLRPSDPQRIVRALEVLDATGISLAEWQQEPGDPVLDAGVCERIVISPDRDHLYQRCNQRFDQMLERGAIEELKGFLALDLDPGLPAMRALGVRPLAEYLCGNVALEDAVETAKMETRRYAKRQLTWLRRNMIAWKWTN